jgi:hypothetical protein
MGQWLIAGLSFSIFTSTFVALVYRFCPPLVSRLLGRAIVFVKARLQPLTHCHFRQARLTR